MRQELLKFLVCPIDKKPLSLQILSEMGHKVEEGLLTCSEGHWYPIVQSVPEILLGELRPDYSDFVDRNSFENLRDSSEIGVAQPAVVDDEQSKLKTRESFEAKWERRPDYGLILRDFYDNWFAKKMGLPDVDALEKFIASKNSILEVGIGSGQKLLMMAEGTSGTVIGIDISKAAHYAAHNCRGLPNAHVVRCDLHDLPFPENIFDFIVSDGVLHHTPNTRVAFMSLIPVLETDGDILIHVYKEQGPIREFCDDYLRNSTTQMTPKECWRFSEAITKFAHSLNQSNVTITVPETLPLLGIQSGEYDLQSFFYEHIFKCFWNDQFSFEENVLVNFDWYHPLDAYRHTEQEVIEWFEAAGLVDVVSSDANINGVSVRGKKK